ncbi:MAG TPA: Zn-dependent hydrolase, partial [Rheinheimera sp.]|nr:Zn-dependent hydrolase [Rheinheimera sp.]
MRYNALWLALAVTGALTACSPAEKPAESLTSSAAETVSSPTLVPAFASRLDIYHSVDLTADLSALSDKQRTMLVKLIDASKIMDTLFWRQAFGEDKAQFLAGLPEGKVRQFADINYGPWDRLKGDEPFLSGYAEKPAGAQFYPADMTKEEFEAAELSDKTGLYSVVQRDSSGKLVTVPYSVLYKTELEAAAKLLTEASLLAADKEFANYLQLRAQALLTDNYQPSDFAWMAMKNNPVELVIGPIETYEDQLFGYRAAFEAYVLLKDLSWSEK